MCMLCKFKYTCVCVCVYHLDLLVGKNVSLLYLMNQCRGCYIYTDKTPHGHQNLMNDINCCEKNVVSYTKQESFYNQFERSCMETCGVFLLSFFSCLLF